VFKKGQKTPDCPGFSWNRVNFHKKPGGDRGRTADTN